MALSESFPEGDLRLLLPLLPLSTWRSLGCTCQAEFDLVHSAYLGLAQIAFSEVTMHDLAKGVHTNPRALALRIWKYTGIFVEDESTPKVANAMFHWAHYGYRHAVQEGAKGKARGKGSKQKRVPAMRRSEHLALLAREFPASGTGIQATMLREMQAVEAALRSKLALGGNIHEIDLMPIVPADTPGVSQGQSRTDCSRGRGDFELNALMWATRHGVCWVKSLLHLAADVGMCTPKGWTALMYAAAFESRGVVLDGTSGTDEAYGGYRNRTRGVVGVLLDAGASCTPSVSLDEFHRAFAPTPVSSDLVGPKDIAVLESGRTSGWASAILDA